MIMWKDVSRELPDNTYECIVKMWNQFNGTWVTGIGIYEVSTGEWEIQDNGVPLAMPVSYWFPTPGLEKIS